MARIENVNKVRGALQAMKKRFPEHTSVLVGYSAQYALHVHERTDLRHKAGKIAKYLEVPFRELVDSGKLVKVIYLAVRGGSTMRQALIQGGLRVQRESQKVVPIRTGKLRASAFTTAEEGASPAAAASLARGDAIAKRAREGK